MAIRDKNLAPKARTEAGLTENQVKVTQSALVSLARDYCREAGVHSLKQQIEKIFSQATHRIVKNRPSDTGGDEDSKEEASEKVQWTVIIAENVEDYPAKRPCTKERLFEQTSPGIATGLAWASKGGATLYIECVRVDGATEKNVTLKVTNQLGDVMKKAQI